MANNQLLFEQLRKALQQDDMLTINILLQDQQLGEIKKMSSRIQNIELKQKYIKVIEEWIINNTKMQSDKENNQKIRQIYIKKRDYSDAQSDDNIIQKQVKKRRRVKLEEKIGYQFYGIIKCLMIAYGDLNVNQQSVKIMHSQLQILFENVIQFISLTELSIQQNKQKQEEIRLSRNRSKKKDKKIDKQIDNIIPQNTIKKYLGQIFKQQTKLYIEVSKQYKKATKSTKNKQYSESESYESDQSSDEKSDEGKNSSKHMSANNSEQIQYFANLTKNMTVSEYQSYSQCRSVNFLQNNCSANNGNKKNQQNIFKLIKFVDSNMVLLRPTMRIYDLLSFLCCRILRKVMFIILKNRYSTLEPISIVKNQKGNKKYEEYITSQQIRRTGNSLIEDYEKRFAQIKQANQSIKQIGKKYFIQDLQINNFHLLIPKIYLQNKSNPDSKMINAQQIWQECKHYQQMWINRILGQKQIEKQLIFNQNHSQMQIKEQQEMYEPKTQYAKYIYKNLQQYKAKGNTWLWKKYFTQDNPNKQCQKKISRQEPRQVQIQNQKLNKPKKRVKLESLKN